MNKKIELHNVIDLKKTNKEIILMLYDLIDNKDLKSIKEFLRYVVLNLKNIHVSISHSIFLTTNELKSDKIIASLRCEIQKYVEEKTIYKLK